jgi:hypothetical protein
MPQAKTSTCATCGYSWPTGKDGSHSCAEHLRKQLDHAHWLMRQVLNDLPANKDWLNPDYEKEMLEISKLQDGQKETLIPKNLEVAGEPPFRARFKNRDPDPGECVVLQIDWLAKKVHMRNGMYGYFPTFDEITIYLATP